MWIYMEEVAVAINLIDGCLVEPVYKNDLWHIHFKYKDMDNKDAEITVPVAKDAKRLHEITRHLIAQLKEVSGATVTTQLEEAIAKNGTDNG
jgi:hypothetical protein